MKALVARSEQVACSRNSSKPVRISPGIRGGAEVADLNGEHVGSNTTIFTRTGNYMGIGFAIPSNMVRSVMVSLIKHGKVVRGWLGVSIKELIEDLAKEFGVP
ncbi:MAG TPA: hypothetical protein VNK46_01775 [Nitrospiraceae bacterium]|jgi:serine protease Do|nr:hypothetical protein [Nitrospiraceae bacterium]